MTCWGSEEGLLDHLSALGLRDVLALSTSDHPTAALHACAVHRDGTVSCWGAGHEGQLGQGDTNNHYLPVTVPGITDAVAVAAGVGATCVVHRDGGVSCWGSNLYGQLGNAPYKSRRNRPQLLPTVVDVVAISAGREHSCAIHRDGGLSCWGLTYGPMPRRVNGPAAVSSVSVGWNQTCIATIDGEIYCWTLGATTADFMWQVGSISNAVDVSVGNGSACALHRDGGVSCWGRTKVASGGAPVRLDAITDAVDVSVSSGSATVGAHACALHNDGSVSCWGGNELGQLGDGTHDNGGTNPRLVKDLGRIAAHQVPATPTELLRGWTDTVVKNREAEFPWLRAAWGHIRGQTSFTQSEYGGLVYFGCDADTATGAFGCLTTGMALSEISLGAVIHELLHIYDLHTGLAPNTAWGAVQLYFATTYPDCFPRFNQPGAEILADTVTHVMVPHAWLTYYHSPGCPTGTPTVEAEQVALQGFGWPGTRLVPHQHHQRHRTVGCLASRSVTASHHQPDRRVRRAVQHRLDHLSLEPGAPSSLRQQPVQRRRMLMPRANRSLPTSESLETICRKLPSVRQYRVTASGEKSNRATWHSTA